jgi:hypothetical protein
LEKPIFGELNGDLLELINSVNILIKKLRNRNIHFDIPKLVDLQRGIDKIAVLWTKLFGIGDITNYYHLLFAGHIRDALNACGGSLFFFQNQGWEAKNSEYKQFFWRKTQRGGSAGNGGERGKSSSKENIKHESIMQALFRFSSRLLMYRLYDPETDALETRIKGYEKELQVAKEQIADAIGTIPGNTTTSGDEDADDGDDIYSGNYNCIYFLNYF